MQIFLARNQVQAGPYTLTQLNNMLATGEVQLTDLMWHVGMEQWKPVGEVTHGQLFYNPNGTAVPPTEPKKVSVADLYGKKETESTASSGTQSKKPNGFTTFNTNQSVKTLKIIGTANITSIGKRVLAVLIDFLLLVACYIPFLSGIGFDFSKISATAGDVDSMTQLAQSVPEHLSTMTSVMFLVLLVIQLVLLVRRGQTIGKLILGIRIVDVTSNQVPSITNLILLRNLVTSIFYILPMVGPIFLLADFVVMAINKQRQSLHDKLAKTIVVEANPEQLKK